MPLNALHIDYCIIWQKESLLKSLTGGETDTGETDTGEEDFYTSSSALVKIENHIKQ